VPRRIVDDPEQAFEDFFTATVPALRRLAVARTGDWAAADDLVQEAMADAHRRWAVIGSYDDPAAWARRAVLNRSVSRWRRKGRERRAIQRLGGRRSTVVRATEPRLADEELWTAVRRLPDRQRDVVLLLWFEDLPAAEVARVLGCAEDTVRTHWRRARSRLAAELGAGSAAAAPDAAAADDGGRT